MIKIAETAQEFEVACQLAMKFAEASPYIKYVEEGAVHDIIARCMAKEDSIVLIDEEGRGMLVGTIVPFIYGSKPTAVELAWWVNPSERHTGVGRDLINLFEAWARIQGCSFVVMISMDEDIGKYYEKRGYGLRERTYMKEI